MKYQNTTELLRGEGGKFPGSRKEETLADTQHQGNLRGHWSKDRRPDFEPISEKS